jgi:hypothetical protein
MRPVEKHQNNEKGAALVITLSLLLLITLLGLSGFDWSMDELHITANDAAWTEAQYLAESGVALLLQWFQDPESFPEIGAFPRGYPAGNQPSFLTKRQIDSRGVPSFFNIDGESQFSGTREEPDFLYQSETDSRLLVGESWERMGDLTGLRVFAPVVPGAICTVEATGTTLSGIQRTVSVQMIPSPIPPVTGAVQTGNGSSGQVPILVHWGDVRVVEDADLGGSLESIPIKDSLVEVTGWPYGSSNRRDPWLDFYVGESVINPPSAGCPDCPEPFLNEGYSNIHQFQNQIQAGFRADFLPYQRLKSFAKEWGSYYATDVSGALYLDGIMDAAHRVTLAQAMASNRLGKRHGLVFIDTVDGNPPVGTNLASLDLSIDYLEGLFFIQANLILRETGPGRSIQVLSPPPEGNNDPSTQHAVTLSNIHLKGVLSVAGQITVEGHPMVFGAVLAQQGFTGSGQSEVWYDADLGTGYYSGLPAVTIQKGSWSIR